MTIRAVFAVATKYGCSKCDVETAFLTVDMDCEVWVRMPSLWGDGDDEITGDTSMTQPRRLLKGVPGIPKAAVCTTRPSKPICATWGGYLPPRISAFF